MRVSKLGEFGLIDILEKIPSRFRNNQQTQWQRLIIGIGDDAAWQGDASIQLATIDSFIQDIHFTMCETFWKNLGWKAIAVNLSDITAMGGIPKYALVSLAVTDYPEVEDITALCEGIIELAQQFDVAIVGGDTSNAPLVAINIAILDSSNGQGKSILTRSTARPGYKIAVSGYLGAAAGVRMLSGKLQFSPEITTYFQKTLQHLYPRVAEGQLLIEQGIKTAIDISDGLVQDLSHKCKASHVGAQIEIDRMPIQPEAKNNFRDEAIELALSSGDDYELLFTSRIKAIDKVKKSASYPITIIGKIVADITNGIT